jgi:hypothetical protein
LLRSKCQNGTKCSKYILGAKQKKKEEDFLPSFKSDAYEITEGRKEDWIERFSDSSTVTRKIWSDV